MMPELGGVVKYIIAVSTVSPVGLDEKPLKRLKEILKAARAHPVETV
jgi:hypothetical protein